MLDQSSEVSGVSAFLSKASRGFLRRNDKADEGVTAPLNEEALIKTLKLHPEECETMPDGLETAYGLDMGRPLVYLTLPMNIDPDDLVPCWEIELHGLAPRTPPLGLRILGDVILGVDRGEEMRPNLDLEPYGAHDQGVSRQHALIRPTGNRLYLIDLDSMNGTRHNLLRVGRGTAVELQDYDAVTLGRMCFTVRIITRPDCGAE